MKNLQLHQGFLTPLANFHNSLAHCRSIRTARRYFVMASLQCRFASASALAYLESGNPPAVLPDGRRLAHAVFISYSTDDTVLANSICAAFEADGIRCWIAPRDVQGGRAYSGQITQAIREARVVFVILSGSANRSKHVLREVERGAHCQNYFLTFRVKSIAH